MKSQIISGVVLQYPEEVSEEQIRTILAQELELYSMIHQSLGGILIEIDETELVVQSWPRGKVKQIRRIPDYIQTTFAPVMEEEEQGVEDHVATETQLPPLDLPTDAIEHKSTIQKILDKFGLGG